MIDKIETGKRFEQCMKKANITNVEITKTLSLNKNAVGNLKNGILPHADTLYYISNYLGTTVEYLLTGKEATELTADEQELINCYRRADNRGKRNIMRQAELESEEQESSTSKIG